MKLYRESEALVWMETFCPRTHNYWSHARAELMEVVDGHGGLISIGSAFAITISGKGREKPRNRWILRETNI